MTFSFVLFSFICIEGSGFLVPEKQEVQVGETFIVDVRLDVPQAISVASLVLQYGQELKWLGFENSGSDFHTLVEPSLIHDLATRTLQWVEGSPNPGLDDSGIRTARLVFQAIAAGDANLEWVAIDEEAGSLFSMGSTPQKIVLSMNNATVHILAAAVQKTFIVPQIDDFNGDTEIGMLADANGGSVTVSFFSPQGKILAESSWISLAPFSQTLIEIPPEARVQGVWCAFQGSGLLGGYVVSQNPGQQTLHAYPAVEPSGEIAIPHIAKQTSVWYTLASLVQWNEDALNVSAFYQGGNIPLSLNHRSSIVLNFNDYFQNQIPDTLNAPIVRDVQYQSGVGGIEVFAKQNGRQIVSLGLDGDQSPQIFFTHIAKNLSVFWNGLALSNMTREEAHISLYSFKQTGESLPIIQFLLNPLEKVTVLFRNASNGSPETITSPEKPIQLSPDIDWIEVNSDRNLAGYALFGAVNDEYLAGFQTAKAPSSHLMFPCIKGDWTGFALVNTSDQSVNTIVRVFDAEGNLQNSYQMGLSPREKRTALNTAFFDGQPLPGEATHVMIEQLQGNPALAGFELFGDLGDRKILAGLLAISY